MQAIKKVLRPGGDKDDEVMYGTPSKDSDQAPKLPESAAPGTRISNLLNEDLDRASTLSLKSGKEGPYALGADTPVIEPSGLAFANTDEARAESNLGPEAPIGVVGTGAAESAADTGAENTATEGVKSEDSAVREGIKREDNGDDVSKATYTARSYPLSGGSSEPKEPLVDSSEDRRELEEQSSTARDTGLAGAGTIIGAGAVGAGALAAQENKNNADDVEQATYTDRSVPVGTSSGSQERATSITPHVPGEFPTEGGEDPHVPGQFPSSTGEEKEEHGGGTGAAVASAMGLTVGGAAAGAAVASSDSNDSAKATEKDLHPGGQGFPYESSQTADSNTGRDAAVAGGAPKTTNITETEKESPWVSGEGTKDDKDDSNLGRDAAIAGGATAAAGAGAAGLHYASKDSTTDTTEQDWPESPRDVGREHAKNLTTVPPGSPEKNPSRVDVPQEATKDDEAQKAEEGSNLGRNAAIAGGATAAVGAGGAATYYATRDDEQPQQTEEKKGFFEKLRGKKDDKKAEKKEEKKEEKKTSTTTTTTSDKARETKPQEPTEEEKDSNLGRNTAIAGGATAAAGGAAYYATRDDEQPQETEEKKGFLDKLRGKKDEKKDDKTTTTTTTTTSTEKPREPERKEPIKDEEDSNVGRDAAIAGGATAAAGAGAGTAYYATRDDQAQQEEEKKGLLEKVKEKKEEKQIEKEQEKEAKQAQKEHEKAEKEREKAEEEAQKEKEKHMSKEEKKELERRKREEWEKLNAERLAAYQRGELGPEHVLRDGQQPIAEKEDGSLVTAEEAIAAGLAGTGVATVAGTYATTTGEEKARRRSSAGRRESTDSGKPSLIQKILHPNKSREIEKERRASLEASRSSQDSSHRQVSQHVGTDGRIGDETKVSGLEGQPSAKEVTPAAAATTTTSGEEIQPVASGSSLDRRRSHQEVAEERAPPHHIILTHPNADPDAPTLIVRDP